jgi:hypothetical protein
MLKELQQARRQRRRDVYPRVPRLGAYVALRAVTNVLLRDLNVSLIAEQMSKGTPVIFCDFVDYDEVAHHAGPLRHEAMQTLEGLDRVLGTLQRLSAHAGRTYEIVVLSDHGQSQGATFRQRYGEPLDAVVARLTSTPEEACDESGRSEDWGRVNVLLDGVAGQGRARSAAVRVATRAVPAPDEPEERDNAATVTVVSGNLAMVYLPGERRLSLEEINATYPELIEGLARHAGIGLVVVGSAEGPMVFGAKGTHRLRDGHVQGDDPLPSYGPNAARDLLEHQNRRHVGDLVLISVVDAETEEVAAFEELVGSHGGLGGWQTEAILMHPRSWPLDEPDIVGPDALYRQLVRWLDDLGLRRSTDRVA